jgi:hypothetical protein
VLHIDPRTVCIRLEKRFTPDIICPSMGCIVLLALDTRAFVLRAFMNGLDADEASIAGRRLANFIMQDLIHDWPHISATSTVEASLRDSVLLEISLEPA